MWTTTKRCGAVVGIGVFVGFSLACLIPPTIEGFQDDGRVLSAGDAEVSGMTGVLTSTSGGVAWGGLQTAARVGVTDRVGLTGRVDYRQVDVLPTISGELRLDALPDAARIGLTLHLGGGMASNFGVGGGHVGATLSTGLASRVYASVRINPVLGYGERELWLQNAIGVSFPTTNDGLFGGLEVVTHMPTINGEGAFIGLGARVAWRNHHRKGDPRPRRSEDHDSGSDGVAGTETEAQVLARRLCRRLPPGIDCAPVESAVRVAMERGLDRRAVRRAARFGGDVRLLATVAPFFELDAEGVARPSEALRMTRSVYRRQGWGLSSEAFQADVVAVQDAIARGGVAREVRRLAREAPLPGRVAAALDDQN